jgi:hypothetical protein
LLERNKFSICLAANGLNTEEGEVTTEKHRVLIYSQCNSLNSVTLCEIKNRK